MARYPVAFDGKRSERFRAIAERPEQDSNLRPTP
jgi:hypothetical protein